MEVMQCTADRVFQWWQFNEICSFRLKIEDWERRSMTRRATPSANANQQVGIKTFTINSKFNQCPNRFIIHPRHWLTWNQHRNWYLWVGFDWRTQPSSRKQWIDRPLEVGWCCSTIWIWLWPDDCCLLSDWRWSPSWSSSPSPFFSFSKVSSLSLFHCCLNVSFGKFSAVL